jgi:hypothetical protein
MFAEFFSIDGCFMNFHLEIATKKTYFSQFTVVVFIYSKETQKRLLHAQNITQKNSRTSQSEREKENPFSKENRSIFQFFTQIFFHRTKTTQCVN